MEAQKPKLWKRISPASIGFVLFGMGIFWIFGNNLTAPSNIDVPAPAPPAIEFAIRSSDDVTLAASFWPLPQENSPIVLILHGNGGHRNAAEPLAHWLHEEGYGVLAIDFRGHGNSTPAGKSFGLFEARDARAAFNLLKSRHPQSKIGVIGFSLGGAAALLGEEGPLPADALVLEAVYPTIRDAIFNRVKQRGGTILAYGAEPLLSFQSLPRFGVWPAAISPIDAVTQSSAPTMVIARGADVYTPLEESQQLFEAAGEQSEFWVIDGVTHNAPIPIEKPEYREILRNFLGRHLAAAPTE